MRGKSVGFHGWNSSPGPEKWSSTNFRPCASEIGLERLLKADKTSSEIEGHRSLDFGCRKRKNININHKDLLFSSILVKTIFLCHYLETA